MSFVTVLIAAAACTSDSERPEPDPTRPSVPEPSRTATIVEDPTQPRLWAVANEGGAAFARGDGPREARTFDLITAQRGVYDGQLRAMREVNPHVKVLGYLNGALLSPSVVDDYPAGWLARDAAGNSVSSVSFGNVLVNPRARGWVQDRADACRQIVERSGYDGCMLDVLGVAPLQRGYVGSVPIDPQTGAPFTERDWLQATSALAVAVKSAVGDDALVVVNGLDDATRYYADVAPSSVLVQGVDGGVAEGWLRNADAPLSFTLSEQDWLRHIEMVEDLASQGKVTLILTKAWAQGTDARKAHLHEFALASFLLGAGESSYFEFSYGPRDDPTRARPLDRVDVGDPIGPRTVRGAVHVRRFERGIALVNPTASAQTIEVGEGLVGVNGPVGAVLRLPPYTGRVLQEASTER